MSFSKTLDEFFSLEEKISQYFDCPIDEEIVDMRDVEFDYDSETVCWIDGDEFYQADVYRSRVYEKPDLILVYLLSDFGGEYIAIFDVTKRNTDIWE